MNCTYIVKDFKANKTLGAFPTEAEAEKLANKSIQQGVYTTIECHDRDGSLIFSSNELNWVGDNGNWNTNA